MMRSLLRRIAPAVLLTCAAALHAQASIGELSAAYKAGLERFRLLADFGAPGVGESAPGSPGSTDGPREPYSLADLRSLLRRGNPAAAAAAAALRAAEGDLSGARGARLPALGGSIQGAFLGNPQDAIVIPMGAFSQPPPALIPPADVTVFPAVDPTQYSFKLTGTQPLFTWGRINAGVRSAEAGVEAARLGLAKVEHENDIRLRGDLETLWYLAEAESILALQRRAGVRLAALAEQNRKSGFLTDAEYLDVQVRVKAVDLGIAELAERRERILAEIGALIGLPGLRLDQLALEPPPAGGTRETEAAAEEAALAGNYDLALADAWVAVKDRLYSLARTQARALPDLGLSVELSYSGSRFPFLEKNWEDKGDYQVILGLGASGRILGDAVKAGALARAKAELEQARAQREDAERRIRSLVRQTSLGMDLARARIEYALLKQESWMANLDRQDTMLGLGAGSESDYLSLLMEALGGLAEAYGFLAEYRGAALTLEAIAGRR